MQPCDERGSYWTERCITAAAAAVAVARCLLFTATTARRQAGKRKRSRGMMQKFPREDYGRSA